MEVDGGDGEALFAQFSRGVEAGQYAAAEASLLKLKVRSLDPSLSFAGASPRLATPSPQLLLLTPGADRGLLGRTSIFLLFRLPARPPAGRRPSVPVAHSLRSADAGARRAHGGQGDRRARV
jgi:hypothetical protein